MQVEILNLKGQVIGDPIISRKPNNETVVIFRLLDLSENRDKCLEPHKFVITGDLAEQASKELIANSVVVIPILKVVSRHLNDTRENVFVTYLEVTDYSVVNPYLGQLYPVSNRYLEALQLQDSQDPLLFCDRDYAYPQAENRIFL